MAKLQITEAIIGVGVIPVERVEPFGSSAPLLARLYRLRLCAFAPWRDSAHRQDGEPHHLSAVEHERQLASWRGGQGEEQEELAQIAVEQDQQ